MAEGREGAHEILAVDAARGHRVRAHDRYHHDALADRAGLSGAEAGGRARSFRRTKLARVPSSRDNVHCRLWISWSPKGPLFPPRDLAPDMSSKTCPSRKLPNPEAPPLRPERHVPHSIATLRRRLNVSLVTLPLLRQTDRNGSSTRHLLMQYKSKLSPRQSIKLTVSPAHKTPSAKTAQYTPA